MRPDSPPHASYTLRTRDWLDRVHSMPREEGGYMAHEPVYGFGSPRSSPHQAARIARTGRLVQMLAAERFDDLLDVGACEGYTADALREFLGVRVATCDLSGEACLRARELFGIPSFVCNAARLPLEDDAFDCVLCSEVIEHLEDPCAAIDELMRVARRLVVITTMECCHLESQRRLMLRLRDFKKPHLEINWWMRGDFKALMGPRAETRRQIRLAGAPPDRERDASRVRDWLEWAADPNRIEKEGSGIAVIWRKREGGSAREPMSVDPERLWSTLARARPLGRPLSELDERWVHDKLRCPVALGRLQEWEGGLRSGELERDWPDYKGLPDLTVATGDTPRPMPWTHAPTAVRLRAMFSPANVAPASKRPGARRWLAAIETLRDLKIGLGFVAAARGLRRSLAELRRDRDPRAEGWLVKTAVRPHVYRIERGRRRHIASERVFHDLGYLMDQIKEVEPDWLERFPEGEIIDGA